MKISNYVSDKAIILLRVLLLVLILLANGIMHYQRIINGTLPLTYDFRFFTTQTNYMIMIWLFLFFLWRNDEDKLDSLNGFAKGALTVYITLVALVYIILIAPDHNPEGLFVFTNLLHHYIIPPVFVLDTLLTFKTRYSWMYPVYWLAYPLLYLPYALILAEITGFYTYFFINIPELGIMGFVQWVAIMIGLFYIFGLIYTFINRNLTTSSTSDVPPLMDQID